jgi:hypothetical protein
MPISDSISGANDRNLPRLAKGLDLSPQETAAVINAVMPEFRHYMERRTLSRGGLADVVRTLGNQHRQEFLKPEVDLASQDATSHGNQLLGEIFETKYRSRALADRAASETGVPADKIRQMLPRIANVSMGVIAEQTRPALQDVFKKLPGFPSNPRNTDARQSPGSPLPLPDDNWGGGGAGNRNGYDDLSDILKRPQRPLQSNPLWDIARQILGTAMGFESKGIAGYIIRFIIYRFGWRILRAILGRFVRI